MNQDWNWVAAGVLAYVKGAPTRDTDALLVAQALALAGVDPSKLALPKEEAAHVV